MRKQTHTQLQNGERMDASKLTNQQLEYICRCALVPILQEQIDIRRNNSSTKAQTLRAKSEMLWLGEIFRTVGWWNDASIKAFHDEFTAERLNAEEEDRGNQ